MRCAVAFFAVLLGACVADNDQFDPVARWLVEHPGATISTPDMGFAFDPVDLSVAPPDLLQTDWAHVGCVKEGDPCFTVLDCCRGDKLLSCYPTEHRCLTH